jgi:DNA (cytosine-5)-methyltransferase 1
MTNRKTAIDLFSGCGGLSWGLKKAGFDLVGAVELDTLAAKTYQLNFPNAAVLQEDITTISPQEFRKQLGLKKGELSLLAGCPPCQGFSTLRTHHRSSSVAKEPMNDLIFRVLDFVREFEPKAVMIENVPGLSKDDRIQKFKSELERLGYQCDFEVHNAKDYGTPQKRKRMIFIGLKGQAPVFAKANKKQKSVKDAISDMPAPEQSDDPMHNYGVKRCDRIEKLISLIPKDGGSRSALPDDMQLECHKRQKGFNDIYGRMAWDEPSPTITCGCTNPSKGRFLHPEQNRAITAREAALLQGFPRGFKFDMSKWQYAVAKLIGNAFPPPFAQRHAEEVAKLI